MGIYEKKYKDALGWMQSLYSSLHGAILEDAEHYFPELKESEDERISREITDFICWATDRGCITKEQVEKSNSWLAWLEKQGETSTEDFGEFINILSKQFPEVSFAKLSRIAVRVKKWLEKQDSPVLSNSSNIGKPEDLEAAATNYAQDKYLPVQMAIAFKAGAEWMLRRITTSSPAGQAPT